jgi:S-adenosylmethionine:tRNA ribosyltransferase-isomerase
METHPHTLRLPLKKEDFNYELPEHLVAQNPSSDRGNSRLLALGESGHSHLSFQDLPSLLRSGDLLVVNDTRVIKARLKAQKDSGGQAEILIERIESENLALCQVRVSKALKPGRTLRVAAHLLRVVGRVGEFYRVEFPVPVLELLESSGSVPLPPYIRRSADRVDEERYQTIWNREPGAVAAPTAGLHFTPALLDSIRARGVAVESVTLHIGAGTFQPIRVNDLRDHQMHSERYVISECCAEQVRTTAAAGGRIIAVGTTVVRALEAASTGPYRLKPGADETAIFITPGYRFQTVDGLVTNLHLPESTLLMLVSAFGGYQRVRHAYEIARAHEYRFFSYGDALFLERDCQ